MEQLSETVSYNLWHELDSHFESASKTLKFKNITTVKDWSECQAPNTELRTSGSSHSKSCDQLRCGLYLSSGDITDALSIHSDNSSSSNMINMSFVPESSMSRRRSSGSQPPSCPQRPLASAQSPKAPGTLTALGAFCSLETED